MHERSEPPMRARREGKARPWYLVVAMCLIAVFGAMSAASGCSNVSYLRGSSALPDTIDQLLQQSQTGDSTPPSLKHPLARASLVREQARLVATSAMHRRAFPLSLAQLLLGLSLVATATAALAGRPGWRELGMQFLTAHAALAIAGFVLLAPVREAATNAAAVELVDRGVGLDAAIGRDASIGLRKQDLASWELQLLLAQIGLCGLGGLALARPRTKEYFAAFEPPCAGVREHPDA